MRWLAVALFVVVCFRGAHGVVVFSVCVLMGVAGGASAWNVEVVESSVECEGIAIVRTDPSPAFSGIRLVIELSGQRYSATAFGVPAGRLARRSAGESVSVKGMCAPLRGNFERSDRIRHITGRMSVSWASENFSEGAPLLRAANRMRASMENGVRDMTFETRSLFMGLVVGDDRHQPRDMVQRFRQSGLSHLCAASGQNVAYLLALASPLLKKRSPRVRWLLTLAIIAWFVVLTRAEPSVLRAGWMAAAVATNAVRRAPMNARTVLSLSVMCLLVIDPMLAWSVGFSLSVGATAGLAWLSAPLGKVVGTRGVLASTLAAQIGTFPVSLAVFGGVPVVSLVANPLALPVAGAVMTLGLPVSLAAAAVPVLVSPVSFIMSVPVMWVDGVARVASSVSPTGHGNTALWLLVALVVCARWWVKRAGRLTSVAG